MNTLVIVVAIVIVGIVFGLFTVIMTRLTGMEYRLSDLERRIEQVAEAGKILNRQIMELDSRGRMRDRIEAVKAEHSGHSHVTQEQVDEAKTRAKL